MNVSEVASIRTMCDYCQRFDLLNMLNEAIVLFSAKTGNILFMNEKALEMYQYTNDEYLNLSIDNIRFGSQLTLFEHVSFAKKIPNGHIMMANQVKKDGSLFKAEISTRYMNLHGEKVFVSIVRTMSPCLEIREQIALAGKVQRRQLPKDLENDFVFMRTCYQPHNYVSGDFYDVDFDEEKNILQGIVIDVMGHGISSAVQTGILQYLFSRVTKKSISVKDKLAWMNKEVMPFFEGGGFAAAFLFEFDFKCKTLTYSAAGINHFIVLKDQESEIIKTPGLFLGIKEDAVFDQEIYHFRSGDSFFFLTDGIFDLISRSISKKIDFSTMHEMHKAISDSPDCNDDATSVGILIR